MQRLVIGIRRNDKYRLPLMLSAIKSFGHTEDGYVVLGDKNGHQTEYRDFIVVN